MKIKLAHGVTRVYQLDADLHGVEAVEITFNAKDWTLIGAMDVVEFFDFMVKTTLALHKGGK